MGGFKWREMLVPDKKGRGGHGSGNGNGNGAEGPQGEREGGPGPRAEGQLASLPPELLAHVLSFLPGMDIASAAQSCSALYQASRIECLWQKKCFAEYRIPFANCSSGLSCMDFYMKVLQKYGHLIGLWQTDISSYGGLVQVKFEEDKLIGSEWHPPQDPKLQDPLRKKDLFSIELTPTNQVQVLCLKGSRGPHKCHIDTKNQNSFYSKCCCPDNHKHIGGKQQEFVEWLQEEVSQADSLDVHLKELLLMKFLMIREYENSFEHHRLDIPLDRRGAVIQPGLFKGTYSAHGLELVMLTYEEDGQRVKATKITGDPNVPTGQITFKADLRYPIKLTESQQTNIQELQKQEVVASPMDRLKQPFCIPLDCLNRDQIVPRTCKARFYAFGQIAGHGFTNPSFIRGHWIIFDEDLFGFLWFELLSLSLFHRVQEL